VSGHEALSLEEVQARRQQEIFIEDYYERLRECGLDYGVSFRGIEKLWRWEDEALGQIRLPESLKDEAERYQFHPSVLDACFQVLAAAISNRQGQDSSSDLYLPVGFDQFRLFDHAPSMIWCHAMSRPSGEAKPEFLVGDFRIFNDAGNLICEITGLRL